MKTKILKLHYHSGPIRIEIRADSFEIRDGCVCFQDAGEEPGRSRTYVPLHQLLEVVVLDPR